MMHTCSLSLTQQSGNLYSVRHSCEGRNPVKSIVLKGHTIRYPSGIFFNWIPAFAGMTNEGAEKTNRVLSIP